MIWSSPAGATTKPGGASSTPVGYIGCSLTWMSVAGYHADGGTRLWAPFDGYGGGEIPNWFQDLSSPAAHYWPIFDRALAMTPADTFWVQACLQTPQVGPLNVSQAEAIVAHIRREVPGATVYFSAMNGWNPAGNCAMAAPTAVAQAQAVTDALVAEGLVLRGPVMPVLPASQTVDTCHPTAAGQALLGNALLSFFDTTTTTGSPPPPTFTETPADPSGAQARFAFSDAQAGVTFRCSVDGAAASACASPDDLVELREGVHTFSVRATGRAGASGPATFTWTVDTTAPPTPTFVTTPSDSGAARARFSFTDTEIGVTFRCSLDGAPFAVCVSPTALSGLTSGGHRFTVRARDDAGNMSNPAIFRWTVS